MPEPKIRSNGVSKILDSLSRPGEFLILPESPLLVYPAKLCITIVSSFSCWVFTVVPREIKVNAFGFFFLVCLGEGGGGVREERVGVKPVVSSQCDNGELSVVKKKRKEK